MSGSAMSTMEASIVAISIPSVVMNSAIHLRRSLAAGACTAGEKAAVTPTSVVPPAGGVPVPLPCVRMLPPAAVAVSALRFRNPMFRLG